MRTLVLGGYGLIGTAVVLRLLAAGYAVVGLGRRVAVARRRYPGATWIERDIAKLVRPDDWAALIDNIDAVVNCSGALQESSRDNLDAVQSAAMRALFQACAQVGVRQVVQVSAVGSAPEASTAFMRTKAEADAVLAQLDLDWIILRPGLVISPMAYGATALLRSLASFPLVTPLIYGTHLMQSVHVDDVADAVLLALEGRVSARATYDLVEEDRHALAEIVAAFRAWLGYRPARVVIVPLAICRLILRTGDVLGALGWRSPLRTTSLRQIEAGAIGDTEAWTRATGRRLPGLHQNLNRLPATVQERWFGRLWLLKPLLIAALSAFWLASGLVALAQFDAAAAVLTTRGVAPEVATLLVGLGILIDLVLAMAVLVRRSMPFAALGMVAVTTAYILIASALAPDLWTDPLGPYVKAIPAAALALVAYAVADER